MGSAFSNPKRMASAASMARMLRTFGKVDGQIGLRCMKGGRPASIVNQAAYP